MKCRECGTENPEHADFCQECGKKIDELKVYKKDTTKAKSGSIPRKFILIGVLIIILAVISLILVFGDREYTLGSGDSLSKFKIPSEWKLSEGMGNLANKTKEDLIGFYIGNSQGDAELKLSIWSFKTKDYFENVYHENFVYNLNQKTENKTISGVNVRYIESNGNNAVFQQFWFEKNNKYYLVSFYNSDNTTKNQEKINRTVESIISSLN